MCPCESATELNQRISDVYMASVTRSISSMRCTCMLAFPPQKGQSAGSGSTLVATPCCPCTVAGREAEARVPNSATKAKAGKRNGVRVSRIMIFECLQRERLGQIAGLRKASTLSPSVSRPFFRHFDPLDTSGGTLRRAHRPFPTLAAVNRLSCTDRREPHSRARLTGSLRTLGRFLPALIAASLLAACGGSDSHPTQDPATPAPGVTLVHVEGELEVGNQALISRAVRSAKSTGNKTLIIELDTPGGGLDVLWAIQKQLLDGEKDGLTLVTWVHNHATSAGALVSLTCKRIYMSSTSTIGASEPVAAGAHGIEAIPEGVRAKVVSFLRAEFRSMAEKRGRPTALAVAMVDRDMGVRQVKVDGETKLITFDEWDSMREAGTNVELVKVVVPRGELLTLTAKEALEYGIADGIADDLEHVLDKLGIPAAVVATPLQRSNSEFVVTWLALLTPYLLLAGLVLGYLELKLPGFGLPGVLSIVCFVLLLAGQYLAGLADVPHIVAVAVGAAMVAVEVFVVPGTLWLGIVGLLLVVGGLILGSLGPGFDISSPMDQELVISAATRILVTASVALVIAFTLSRFLPKIPVGRRLVLAPSTDVAAFAGAMPETQSAHAASARPGALGRSISALRPVGKVVLDDTGAHEWEARSSGALLDAGVRVRVVEVSAARLVVEGVFQDDAGAGAELRA